MLTHACANSAPPVRLLSRSARVYPASSYSKLASPTAHIGAALLRTPTPSRAYICITQVPDCCPEMTPEQVTESAFELIFAFDEIVALGYREDVNIQQVHVPTLFTACEWLRARALLITCLLRARLWVRCGGQLAQHETTWELWGRVVKGLMRGTGSQT
jgi:hypothetical protein